MAAAVWAGPTNQLPSLLPSQFAGWQMTGQARTSTEPGDADQAYAPVLREYGFHDFAMATYTRPGRTMTVRAARFNDASGAYGAFTFYKDADMQTEKIGDQGASNNLHVLFYRGDVLIEAKFDRITAMSAAELRELAAGLPPTPESAAKLPIFASYLPKESYVRHTAKYVVGPAGLQSVNSPLPASVVDFGRGAEVVLGRYSTTAGLATLTMIAYPTPQIAGERLRAIEEALVPGSSKDPDHQPFVKRTGPLVVLVTGDASPAEARSLLTAVNYEADVTWNENTYLSKKDNVGNLIIAALTLCGILILIALAVGFAFGGVRVLLQRVMPGRVFESEEDASIIRLNLPR
jgi:hypothetical protein